VQGPVTAALKKGQPHPRNQTTSDTRTSISLPPIPSPTSPPSTPNTHQNLTLKLLLQLVFVFVFGFSVARGFLGNCELGAEHWETGTAPFVCGYLHDICSYNKPQELLKQQQPQPTGRG